MATRSESFAVDIECHVVPLLELCRFASAASATLNDIQQTASIHPPLATQLRSITTLNEPSTIHAGEMVASALFVALDLLDCFVRQQDGERG